MSTQGSRWSKKPKSCQRSLWTSSLARITQKHPDYKGPQMGPKMATENKRNFTGEQYVLLKELSIFVKLAFFIISVLKVEKISNSNDWRETLLEAIRQNIAGWCQQNYLFSKVCWQSPAIVCLYNSSKLSHIILILTEGVGDEIKSRLPFKIFSTLKNQSKFQKPV